MKRSSIALVLGVALCACQGSLAPRPSKMPAYAEACATGSAEIACLGALSLAAELAERERVGQLLMLAARSAPKTDRRDLGRAALWLAPNAWLPDELRAELEDEALEVSATPEGGSPRPGDGTVLRLRGSRAPLPAGLRALELDLVVPAGDGPLSGATFAGLLAAASGAEAASFGVGTGEAIAPAAPLLVRILGTGLALPEGAWPATRLVRRADGALRAGHHPEARELLEQASATLPANAPSCSVRGAIDYLRTAAARLGFGGADEEANEELRQRCTAAKVSPDEADMQRYLRELGTLESNLGTAAAELPDPWSVPSELEAWARDIEGFAAKLGGRRAAVLRALRDELLARAARPKGSCDLDFEARARTAREAARKALQVSGRDDLALPSIETKREGLRVTVVTVAPLLAWVDRPENRWLRAATWAAALADASLGLVAEAERAKFTPLCRLAYGDVRRDMKQDRLEGFHERNVARWFSVARATWTVCGNVEAVNELGNELLAGALQGEDGKLGVMRVLWLSGWRTVQGLLTGQAAEAVMAVKILGDELGRLQQRLGPSDEDRVLDALISLIRVGAGQLSGQPGDLESTLENVVVNLEGLARKPVRVDAPPLAKAAPGVHLAAVGLLAALHARDEDPRRRDAALERLRVAVDQDLAGLLASFGVSEHADAIRRMVRALPAVARALDSASAADLEALLREVEAADAPGPKEQGWWAVGLELGRVALWDLAAGAAYQAAYGKPAAAGTGGRSAAPGSGGKPAAASGKPTRAGAPSGDPLTEPRVARALERADRVLVRLADGVVRDFGHDGTGWEALYLAPALQRGLAAVFAAPENAPDMAARAAAAAEAGLAAGLPRLSQRLRTARPDEVGFLAVVVDALEAVQAEGGPRKLAADLGARTRWGERMKQRSAAYPREFRVVVDATIAGLEFESSPADAKRRLKQAVSDATSTQLRDVAYLPRLAEAVLLHYDGDTAAALAAVDEVLALGNEALGCGRPHEVHGLMPYRAWALERLGKHAEADAMLGRYLELGKTYGGDGFVHCRVASYRPTFTFTGDVKQRIGSLFFPTSAEGTFQLGMGTGDARNLDRLACAPTPLWAPRYDLVLSAELARAAYALRAGNDAAAHSALLAALDTGRLLVHGDVRSLGVPDGAGAEEARKHAFLPLLVWVATAARGRGQLAVAAELDAVAQGIAAARSETVAGAFNTRPGTPVQLALLGFDALGPLVASTWKAPDATAAGTAARIGPAQPTAEPSERPVVSPWGQSVLEAYAALRNNRAVEARAALGRARPPAGDVLARLTLLRSKAWIGRGLPKVVEVKAAMDELGRLGLLGEAAWLGAEQAALLAQAKKGGDAAELYRHALGLLPAERAPLLRAEILRQLAGTLTDEAALGPWARDLAAVAPALQGRIALDQELSLLQQLVVVLLRERDLARLEAPVERLRAIFERAAGGDDPQTLQLSVAALALRSVASGPPAAELADLLAKARRLGEAAKALVPILEELDQHKSEAAERRRLAIEVMDQLARK